MNIVFFSAQAFEKQLYEDLNQKHYGFSIQYLDSQLNEKTVSLAENADVVCCFVNDVLNKTVIDKLYQIGVKLIALRSAGFNHVDHQHATHIGLPVAYVPDYSPEAVAEFTIGLMLSLSRKIHRSYTRTKEGNFSLEGLMGFNLSGQTVGIIGLGRIGFCVAQILKSFGCHVIAYDITENPLALKKGIVYQSLDTLLTQSDIITLHCPLNETTQYLIQEKTIQKMKPGVILINTGRGGLMDTQAVINALKADKIGALAMDVYEKEASLFFHDQSNSVIKDDMITRLMTLPNVLITGHQAFFTNEAVHQIAQTTLDHITHFFKREWDKVQFCANPPRDFS